MIGSAKDMELQMRGKGAFHAVTFLKVLVWFVHSEKETRILSQGRLGNSQEIGHHSTRQKAQTVVLCMSALTA